MTENKIMVLCKQFTSEHTEHVFLNNLKTKENQFTILKE